MDDKGSIELYWHRSEQAIAETEGKYGGHFFGISYNILRCREDAEECVGDTWLRACSSRSGSRRRQCTQSSASSTLPRAATRASGARARPRSRASPGFRGIASPSAPAGPTAGCMCMKER